MITVSVQPGNVYTTSFGALIPIFHSCNSNWKGSEGRRFIAVEINIASDNAPSPVPFKKKQRQWYLAIFFNLLKRGTRAYIRRRLAAN